MDLAWIAVLKSQQTEFLFANLEVLLLQQYDHDFSESSEDKMEMSFEDNRFMTRAENSERWCHRLS